MTWTNAPGPDHPGQGEQHWESPAERDARVAWERGSTTLFPAGRMADRISTILLLAFGAVLTILVGVVGAVALVSGVAACDSSAGCSPGAMIGSTALAVGGAFVVGVATVVLSIGAWIRRRPSWWIAATGFVLATLCVVWGGVLFAQAADHGPANGSGASISSDA
jgi:hypothetical protein